MWAANIDQSKAHQEYKKRIPNAAKEKYSEDNIEIIKEELNSPCAEEMTAFDKFIDFILEPKYDVIVFDTAPTGHTLRLLELPTEWNKQIELSGLVSGRTGSLENVKEKIKKAIDVMQNQSKTTFAFVLYLEATPILEAWRAAQELKTVGIRTNLVFANLILLEEHCNNEFFKKRKKMQERYLELTKNKFKVPILTMPLINSEIKGIDMLTKACEMLYGV